MRRFPRSCALAACLLLPLLALPTALAAEDAGKKADWPQYRGRDRDGVSSESGLALDWPATGPPVLWRKQLGSGFAGLAVAGDRLFTTFADGEHEHAAAFDAATGEEIWRAELGATFVESFGDGPRATPTVAGDTVYALGSHGLLRALAAADGASRFEIDLKERFGAPLPQFGFSTAPMVVGDLLVFQAGGGKGEGFAAVDRRTGEPRWTAEDGQPSYSSPIAVTLGGREQLVAVGDRDVVGLDLEGRELWSYDWPGAIAMPILVPPDRVFVSSGGDDGGVMLRIAEKDGALAAEKLWQNLEMRTSFNTAVVHDGVLYGFDRAVLKAVDAATGERLWAARGYYRGSLILADGHLVILGERGLLAIAEASRERFVEKARFQALPGKSWTAPTLAGGRLYLRDLEEMVALDLRK